jgi:large subunit ribosomal protein L30
LRITWKKSAIGYPDDQADTIRSLGLKRLSQTVERPDTPVFRGMVLKVRHLVNVEEIVEEPPRRRAPRRRSTPAASPTPSPSSQQAGGGAL